MATLPSIFDFALGASVLWYLWTYLRGPHNLGRAFRGGDANTPRAGVAALVVAGTVLLDMAVRSWDGSLRGIPAAAVRPASAAAGLAGVFVLMLAAREVYRLSPHRAEHK